MGWIVSLLVGLLPGVAEAAIKKVVMYVLLGALAAGLGGITAYHLVTVHNAYERGASAAREQCSRDAATVKARAEATYQLRARRLEDQLAKLRVVDDAADADDANTKTLEAALEKQKADPVCWSAGVAKELAR